nr:MAG TPA: hypothetical protein [Caudoviricetes sp.]
MFGRCWPSMAWPFPFGRTVGVWARGWPWCGRCWTGNGSGCRRSKAFPGRRRGFAWRRRRCRLTQRDRLFCSGRRGAMTW